jgi:spore maturation protein CgeB
LKITIFGLAITSAWGNGHATTYRSLARALRLRGHEIVFFERNAEWYASNRDMPEPEFCRVHIYEHWKQITSTAHRELKDSDVAIVGSYFPDAAKAIEEVLSSSVRVKAFYDIDTPITLAQLRSGQVEYLEASQIPEFDIYFSFTGGPALMELENRFGAQRAVPLYCSFDPGSHRVCAPRQEFECDLSYMGTYAPDRQEKLEKLFCKPAREIASMKFYLAGAQYPADARWPANVKRTIHLHPRDHAAFYCSSALTLNLTRGDMVQAGFSPSVRMFEAAGCGAAIVSDNWLGLETFFAPNKEILLAESTEEIKRYLCGMDRCELRRIGEAARERVLTEHSSHQRAIQFEKYVDLERSYSERKLYFAIQ